MQWHTIYTRNKNAGNQKNGRPPPGPVPWPWPKSISSKSEYVFKYIFKFSISWIFTILEATCPQRALATTASLLVNRVTWLLSSHLPKSSKSQIEPHQFIHYIQYIYWLQSFQGLQNHRLNDFNISMA